MIRQHEGLEGNNNFPVPAMIAHLPSDPFSERHV